MPTLEKVRELAANFERVYPEELPAQLAWWSEVLEIDRTLILRLIGLKQAEIDQAETRPWSEVIEAESDWAGWIEELLSQLLAIYSYDWLTLSADLKRERTATPSRTFRARTPDQAKLIKRVRYGGPSSLTALRRLLSTSQ